MLPRPALPARARLGAVALLGITGLPLLPPAYADDAAIQRCRLETVAAQRLACYDAIPSSARAAAPAAAKAPAAAVPAAPVPAPQPASSFGLASPAGTVNALDTRIAGFFEGWGPRTRFTLANGQVWEVEDGSSAALALQDPKVRVRRGFAGAFYLELEGTNRSPRVRRLQ